MPFRADQPAPSAHAEIHEESAVLPALTKKSNAIKRYLRGKRAGFDILTDVSYSGTSTVVLDILYQLQQVKLLLLVVEMIDVL
jgi:hypothetical protein